MRMVRYIVDVFLEYYILLLTKYYVVHVPSPSKLCHDVDCDSHMNWI
eukprot:SAG11_NODE_322_length_10757_cov_2.841809_6_plen_47_part_00